LKGLEVTTKNFKEILNETDYFRIDSEFQSHYYLSILNSLNSVKHCFFAEKIELLTDGKHGGVTLTDSGVIFLRNTNIKENLIDLSDLRYISKQESNETKRAEFEAEDLLLTTIGTIGLCVKVPNGFPRATINQNLVRIVLKKKNEASLMCAFLNSKYGRGQLLRWGAGNVYQMINYPNLKNIIIPSFSEIFMKQIYDIYRKSELTFSKSQSLYRQAEDLLLKAIGLSNFKPSKKATNIKSFKESFLKTGRLDAEYYQPKYEKIENKIKELNHAKVKELVSFINHGKQPPYVENGTIRVFSQKWIGDKSIDYSFLNATEEPFTSKEFAKQNTEYVARKNDILYYSVGANLGYCHNYLIDEPIMPGSFITLIRANNKKIDPIYFGVTLNSMVGRMQAEKWKSASAQPYVYPKDISEFIIPVIDMKIQQQIAEMVKESFILRMESERLLVEAREMVEGEIEK
jgi:restriction endonuclease S subunit